MSREASGERQVKDMAAKMELLYQANQDLMKENEIIKAQRGKMSLLISRYKAKYGELDDE